MFGLTKLAQPLAKQSLQIISKRTNITVNGPPQVRMPKWVKTMIFYSNIALYLQNIFTLV